MKFIWMNCFLLRIRLFRKFAQFIGKKIWEQQFPYILNVFTLTNNHMNPSITSTFYDSRKNQNQDSPNSDSRSLSFSKFLLQRKFFTFENKIWRVMLSEMYLTLHWLEANEVKFSVLVQLDILISKITLRKFQNDGW